MQLISLMSLALALLGSSPVASAPSSEIGNDAISPDPVSEIFSSRSMTAEFTPNLWVSFGRGSNDSWKYIEIRHNNEITLMSFPDSIDVYEIFLGESYARGAHNDENDFEIVIYGQYIVRNNCIKNFYANISLSGVMIGNDLTGLRPASLQSELCD